MQAARVLESVAVPDLTWELGVNPETLPNRVNTRRERRADGRPADLSTDWHALCIQREWLLYQFARTASTACTGDASSAGSAFPPATHYPVGPYRRTGRLSGAISADWSLRRRRRAMHTPGHDHPPRRVGGRGDFRSPEQPPGTDGRSDARHRRAAGGGRGEPASQRASPGERGACPRPGTRADGSVVAPRRPAAPSQRYGGQPTRSWEAPCIDCDGRTGTEIHRPAPSYHLPWGCTAGGRFAGFYTGVGLRPAA